MVPARNAADVDEVPEEVRRVLEFPLESAVAAS
jgi:hypothetical protein